VTRWPAWLAWAVAITSLVGLGAAFVVGTILNAEAPRDDPLPGWAFIGFAAALAAFPLSGAIIASQRPRNAVGWIFLVMGASIVTSVLADELALFAFRSGTMIEATPWFDWVGDWSGMPFLLGGPLVFLLFPAGSPPSDRWKPVVWGSAALVVVQMLATLLLQWEPSEARPYPPPLDLPRSVTEVADVVSEVGVLSVLAFPLATMSLLVRYRSAGATERLQLRWFLYASSLAAIVFLLLGAVALLLSFGLDALAPADDLLWFAAPLSLSGAPIAAAVAILRYRLLDIDVLIRRTIVYGALSGVLVVIYVSLVVLVQSAARPFFGSSDLAIAASTLGVVGLAQPLRRRIQGLVDRRFYRARYDAARTLDAFTARLRSEVDIDAVRSDLVGVVDDALRPAHASIWLRQRP
jgi:hypothetical protein